MMKADLNYADGLVVNQINYACRDPYLQLILYLLYVAVLLSNCLPFIISSPSSNILLSLFCCAFITELIISTIAVWFCRTFRFLEVRGVDPDTTVEFVEVDGTDDAALPVEFHCPCLVMAHYHPAALHVRLW